MRIQRNKDGDTYHPNRPETHPDTDKGSAFVAGVFLIAAAIVIILAVLGVV